MLNSVLLRLIPVALAWLGILMLRQLESRRLSRRRRYESPGSSQSLLPATVIVPVRGEEIGLRENLAGWIHQDYPEREIVFVAESPADGAAPVVQSLIAENRHVPARLEFSGPALRGSQRSWQMQHGLEQAGPGDRIFIFASASSKPPGDAVRWFAHALADLRTGVVTGGQWQIPRYQTLPNRLAAAMGNLRSILTGPGRINAIAPSIWAARSSVLADFRREWRAGDSMTMEWPLVRWAFRRGLAVRHEPQCTVERTIDLDWSRLADRSIRNSCIFRREAPVAWWAALAMLIVVQAAFWGAVSAMILATAQAGIMSAAGWGLTATLIWGLGALRGILRDQTAKLNLPIWRQYRSARRFDIQGWLVTEMAIAAAMIASLAVRRIAWRGKIYRLGIRKFTMEASVPWIAIHRPGSHAAAPANNDAASAPAAHKTFRPAA